MSRLLHVFQSTAAEYGGPIRALTDLSLRAAAHGLESEFLGLHESASCKEERNGIPVHSLQLTSPRAYAFSHELRCWLRTNLPRFDGVVLHGLWLYPNWATVRECTQSGVPFACFPHGMLEPWPIFQQGYGKALKKILYWHLREKRIVAKSVGILFTTQRERQLAHATFRLPDVPSFVVPYGAAVSAEKVLQPANPDLIIGENRKIALFLGRVHPKKNVDFLLQAWAAAKLPSEWCLVVAGPADHTYSRHLTNFCERTGIKDSVAFVGMVAGKDKAYLYQRASWFLLPSKQENFGNAVLEAIQYRCPVAISDQVYFSEFLHQQSEVMPLHHQTWVDFLRSRMLDETYRDSIRHLDELLVRPRFDIDRLAKAWAATLTSLFPLRVVNSVVSAPRASAVLTRP